MSELACHNNWWGVSSANASFCNQGLIPKALEVEMNKSGNRKIISLTDDTNKEYQPSGDTNKEDDKHNLLQILFLLGVGDSFYHEMSMVHPELPRSYRIKEALRDLDKSISLRRISQPFKGAYCPFLDTLTAELTTQVSTTLKRIEVYMYKVDFTNVVY